MNIFLLSVVFGLLPFLISILQWYDVWYDAIVGELLCSFADGDSYAFIIVGAGSAGAVLANRLSQHHRVLLLEAGGYANVLTEIPGMAMPMLHQPSVDWMHQSIPQNKSCLALNNRVSLWPRGKVLGGSSTLNYMIYSRGNRRDFDSWANLTGDISWSYKNVLPIFKKSEGFVGKDTTDAQYHGRNGELTVSDVGDAPLLETFLEAGKELGYEHVDFNGINQEGFGPNHVTQKNGARWSSYKAFLEPILLRKNLHVLPYSLVEKIHFDSSNRAVAVSFSRHGRKQLARASKEIILSAGAIDSPKLLMLSGVGPSQHLNDLKIKVRADLPVGKNLQDHPAALCGPILIDKPASFMPERDLTAANYYNYFVHGKGPLTTPSGLQAMAFLESSQIKNKNESWPDLQLLMLGMGLYSLIAGDISRMVGVDRKFLDDSYGSFIGKDAFFFLTVNVRPRSRGEILLADSNVHSPPLINPNYFHDPNDLKVLTDGLLMCKTLFHDTEAFKSINARLMPGKPVQCQEFEIESREMFECYIKHYTATLYHPAGTARMGKRDDPTSVVDSKLRVLKVKNLRVIDASIMPVLVNSNSNAASIMIGEKGASLVREYWAKQYSVCLYSEHLRYKEDLCYYSRLV